MKILLITERDFFLGQQKAYEKSSYSGRKRCIP